MAIIKNPTIIGSKAPVLQTKTITPTAAGFTVYPDSGYDALAFVVVQGDANAVAENIKKNVTMFGVAGSLEGGGEQPTLNAVTIARSGNVLNIINPATNGNFATAFKIFSNGTLVTSVSGGAYDLNDLGVGTHTVTVKASGMNFNDSAESNSGEYNIYSVTRTLTNLTSSNTAASISMGNDYQTTLIPVSGKYLPAGITVTVGGNAITLFTYNNSTGAISIPSAQITGNIVITATASDFARLDAPVVSLSGTVLSWGAITNASSYSVRLDGVQVASALSTSFDISTLSGGAAEGAYTVVAQATGYEDSNASNSVTYSAASPIYGVSGMAGTGKTLTRTDDAVGLTVTINSSTGTVSSPFDNLFPWSEATVETIDGNKFLHFPDMWFRIGKDSSKRITDIAVSKTQGSTGSWYKVDSFYYGCYGGSVSNNKLASVSGVARQHTMTRADFRACAANNGSGYHQLDLYHKMVTSFLWLIEWANKDSQSIMRGVDNGTARNTGGTDSLTSPSGFNTSTQQMRYHYIEDFVGNYREWIDGAVWYDTSLYVTADPSKFDDTSRNYNLFGAAFLSSGSGSLLAIGWDEENPFLCYGIENDGSTTYTTGFCDRTYQSSSTSPCLSAGSSWSYSGAISGLLSFYRSGASYTSNLIGGRLLYKP